MLSREEDGHQRGTSTCKSQWRAQHGQDFRSPGRSHWEAGTSPHGRPRHLVRILALPGTDHGFQRQPRTHVLSDITQEVFSQSLKAALDVGVEALPVFVERGSHMGYGHGAGKNDRSDVGAYAPQLLQGLDGADRSSGHTEKRHGLACKNRREA